jgi:mannose-1-phosphate guanylyltransferase
MLRQLWSLVETTQPSQLVSLDDDSLVQCLLKRLKTESSINDPEVDLLNDYINSRLSLIRDLAEARLSGESIA